MGKRGQDAGEHSVPWWQFKRGLPRRGVKGEAQTPLETAALSTSQRKRLNRRRHDLFRFAGAPKTVSTKHLAVLEWVPENHMARVLQPRGKIFQSLGILRGPEQWLYPEEAAFLVDRSSADLLIEGIAASVERCFSLMLHEHIPMEDYYAYAYLRRLGYHVRRSLGEPLSTWLPTRQSSSFEHEPFSFRYDVWAPGNFKRSMPGIPLFRAIIIPFDGPVWTAAKMRRLALAAAPSSARIIAVERSIVTIFEIRSQGPLAKPADPADLWLAERALVQHNQEHKSDQDRGIEPTQMPVSNMDSEDDWLVDGAVSGSENETPDGADSRSVSSTSSSSDEMPHSVC
ncbi:hypothetical protein CCYA_CCYA10G2873 [Cyanidiococcus yangmingshanensis]|nr:hypothetical protein CCYA_CCYA10G2873 [Cyanidiococcus yangmingshanensis]